MTMEGLYALLLSVTCNFQETCDLQVVCTPFGDCGQRATCLQIPFPRNTVCPDPFTNAGPPYTVECFDDAGCQEPMVCCHSYAKSYCHMPPFSPPGGSAAGTTGNPPPVNVVVEPVSETSLMNQGTNGNAPNSGSNSNTNTNGNPGGPVGGGNRGGRSVVIARSDFFDPQGFRRQQRENWQSSLERRRRQQINSLNTNIRTVGENIPPNNAPRVSNSVTDDGFRTSIQRNLNGARLTVEIDGQTQPGDRPFVDIDGVRVLGNNGGPASRLSVGNGVRPDDSRNGDDRGRPGTGIRVGIRQDADGTPQNGILRNNGRPGVQTAAQQSSNLQPGLNGGGINGGAQDDRRGPQTGPGAAPVQGNGNGGLPDRISAEIERELRANGDSPGLRVNLHAGAGARPMIRKVDLWKGHGFYGDRRRILGDVQFDGFANRFRGPIPANTIL